MKSAKRRPWTSADNKLLRQLVKQRLPARIIATKLKRTVKAVYQRGHVSNIRFLGAVKARKK